MNRIVQILLYFLPIAAVGLVIYQIVISNELATLGKDLGYLNNELSVQNDIHELLLTEVASSSSFLRLRVRAEALGFKAPDKDQIIALTPQFSVALGVTSP